MNNIEKLQNQIKIEQKMTKKTLAIAKALEVLLDYELITFDDAIKIIDKGPCLK